MTANELIQVIQTWNVLCSFCIADIDDKYEKCQLKYHTFPLSNLPTGYDLHACTVCQVFLSPYKAS